MPSLLKKIHGDWQICDVAETPWMALEEWRAGHALEVRVDAEPSPEWIEASSIAIKFPAMTDGRGLSLAVLIRKRLGYRGELIARGSVHQDIVHFLARCGFDAIELPDEEHLETALKWIDPHTGYYQPSVIRSESALTSAN